MTVKELISELLDCPMGAEVNVLVEMHKDFMNERLNQYSNYTFPVTDDAEIKQVFQVCNNHVRILLEDASEWN